MTSGLRKGLTSYGDAGFSLFLRKVFIKAAGYSDDALDRPIVGITDTASDFNPCHGNAPLLIEAVKRGVMLAGALPMTFPTISIHESFAHPTSMVLRNLMAMDTEEMIRAQPMDAVVLIGGCDKTMPAQMMAAISADIPAVVLPVGPMVVGHHRGEVLGACTDCRRLWGEHRGGAHRRGGRWRRSRDASRHPSALHGDGHGEHDGRHRRGARPRPAGRGVRPGGARGPDAARRGERTGRGRDGEATGTTPLADRDRSGHPQRHGGAAGDGRLHERARAPGRHRGARGLSLDYDVFDGWDATARCSST